MSTKIFNGYSLEFPATTPIYEVDRWAQTLRARISNVEKYLRAKLFADTAVTLIDRIVLLNDPKRLLPIVNGMTDEKATTLSDHQNPYMVAFEHISTREKKIRVTQERDPLYDFECNAQILHVPGRNILLAMLFTEQDAYRTIWERMPGVREYAYWNNTDPPAYLTETQWERRRRDWDKALGREGIPVLKGFNIECHHVYGHPSIEQIIQVMPTFRSRVRENGEDKMFHQWLNGRSLTASNYFDLYSKYKNWRRTTKGRLAAVKMRHEIAGRLPKEIAKEMLLTSVKELFERFHEQPAEAS